MKITSVSAHLMTAVWSEDPFFPQAPHATALLRIGTDAGLEGWGESTWGYFAPDAVPAMVDYFRPVLLGRDPAELGAVTRALEDDAVWWARSGAGRSVISGLELALWDLRGQALGVPVYQLLGGKVRDSIPVYASGGPTLWPVDATVRKVAHYAGLGYRAVKLSTGFYELPAPAAGGHQARLRPVPCAHGAALDRLEGAFARLRREFGVAVDLAVDGHQGGVPHPIPVSEAVAIAAALAPHRLRFYEEPLAYTNPEGYAELRARSLIPIAGGESLCGLEAFHALISRGGLHVVQPDVGFVGGLREAVRVLHRAEASNLTAALHTGASAGPVLAASWHLAAAAASVEWLEHVPAAAGVQRALLADPFEVRDGRVGLPVSPGLGVRLTPEARERFRFQPASGERT